MTTNAIKNILISHGLKATTQRIAVYETLYNMHNHPSADLIHERMSEKYPSIASGTVYKTLDTLVENKIIKRVKTEGDAMRYDANLNKHHHLYDEKNKKIMDFYDDELFFYLENYFEKKNIPNFNIEDIKLHIIGKFQ